MKIFLLVCCERKYWVGLCLLFLILFVLSACGTGKHQSKYVGQENRKIKSLSPDDIDELQRGGGWGLAKVAELNGVPGPAHLLEMGDKINLTNAQKNKIQEIFNDMNTKAVALGEQLIQLESELNNDFLNQNINLESLEKQVGEIAKVRAKLRVVHLSTHLQTPSILTNEQITLYNELRGYSQDPCENIAEGHNAEKWKKHNGCE